MFTWKAKWTHTSFRFQTSVKTSSVHMKFNFGCVSKRPDIWMDMCRHFISGSVYMMFCHLKWNPISVKMNDMKCIPEKTHICIKLQYLMSLCLFILSCVNSVHTKLSCWFEISFPAKWPIRYPYRFEFHFASIHVNTSKELTEHWSHTDLIPVWVHFASHVSVL